MRIGDCIVIIALIALYIGLLYYYRWYLRQRDMAYKCLVKEQLETERLLQEQIKEGNATLNVAVFPKPE
jgi:hypothetical protein